MHQSARSTRSDTDPDRWPESSSWFPPLASRQKRLLFVIIVLSAALRFIGLGHKQFWVDEIIQAIHSRPDSIGEILKGVAQDRGGAPLDYIVQHYVMSSIGTQSEYTARFHAALFGSISVILIYFISIRLFQNKRIALISTMLYGLYPLHHHYSQEGRPYALFVLLILILFLLYLRIRQGAAWIDFLFMPAGAVLSFYTHAFTAIFFAALLFTDLLRLLLDRAHKIHRGTVIPSMSFLVGACAFFPWFRFSAAKAHGDSWHPLSLHLLPEAIKGLGDGSYPLAIILLIMAGLGVFYLREQKRDSLAALLCWTLVPVPLVLFVLEWRSYFFAIRQLIFITPAIVLLAACGTEYLFGRYGKKAAAVPALYALISITVISIHYPDRRPDIRGTATYLAKTIQAGDRILAPNSLGLIAYYLPEVYRYEYRPSSLTQPAGCRRIFVVESQTSGATGSSEFLRSRGWTLQDQLSLRGIRILVFKMVPTAKTLIGSIP